MTAYNREPYIAAAIESVLSSSYSNLELVITDDQSTDQTVAIARSYAAKDNRVKVFVNENNLGDYSNRNKAASYAKGEYLKYLDADDLIYPHGLAVMVEAMERFPEAGFGLSFSVIDDILPYPRFIPSADIIRHEYLHKSYLGVGPSASIIRRSVFEQAGGFSGKQYVGDTELWLQLGAVYPMLLLQPSLVWWRQHPGQQISQERKNHQVLIDRYHLGLFHLEKNKLLFSEQEYRFAIARRKQHFARRLLADLLKQRDISKAIFLYQKSKLRFVDLLKGFNHYM